MSIRHWVTKKTAKAAEVVAETTKATLQKTVRAKVTAKSDLYFTLGKLGLLGLLLYLSGKEIKKAGEQAETKHTSPGPTHITINNYIHEKERNDSL